MSRSVNKVTLVGNVGNAPEIRTTANGTKVASLSLATGREWKDGSGTKQEKTEWHKLVVWGTQKGDGLAGVVERYVTKGAKLYVEGRIDYRQYEKDGQTKYVTEIVVDEVVLLGGGDPKPETAPEPDATMGDADDLPF
jgi:single-strand DNA-binding protein